MPVYGFRCMDCGSYREHHRPIELGAPSHTTCGACGQLMRRVFHAPGIVKTIEGALFEPHFNHTVGTAVTSPGEFKSELARRSDELSARTGIPHNFKPLDPREVRSNPKAFGVADPDGTIRRRELREQRAKDAGAELRTFED